MQAKQTAKALLTFAHRGEAQAFLRQRNFRPRTFYFEGLYENDSELLLLTGEGLQSTAERLAAVCGAFREEVGSVVNLGIAGSLAPHCLPGAVYSVRTAYGFRGGKVQFKTYSGSDPGAQIDCISADQRILQAADAGQLAHFAPLVDRELWAGAAVCALFNLPFRAYKLVSDRAGEGEFCANIREQAGQFSEQLLDFYEGLSLPAAEAPAAVDDNLPEGFYLTTSQQRRLRTVLQHLKIKYTEDDGQLLAKAGMASILAMDINPKKRTTLLLEGLDSLLNPFNARLRARLDELCRPLAAANCRVQFSRDYEDDRLELTAQIEHPRHLEKLRRALEAFDYAQVIRTLNGEW